MSVQPHSLAQASEGLRAACREINRLLVGQEQVVRHAVAALAAGGHVLFEDVPGTGKTTLATALSQVMGLRFKRVQGTPDLLPGDLVGTMVFHPGAGEFTFRQGPVFTQLLLMDEINRATPRAQSALLEAMAEGQVTVDGRSYRLEAPFVVIATANPVESQGVFPLPEAQLDRFLVQLRLGYPEEGEELEMVGRIRLGEAVELRTLLRPEQLLAVREQVRGIGVSEDVLRYLVRLCRATRSHPRVELGASPRAVLALTSFAQALALLGGRDFVVPDDVQEAFAPVLRHRLRVHADWSGEADHPVDQVLADVLQTVPVPTEFADP